MFSSSDTLILLGASLLLVGIVASRLSSRLGLPLLLLFMGVGMLAGEDGFGGLRFDDFERAFLLSQLALAVILLDGGLRTELDRVRIVLAPAAVLATAGVVITAALTAAFAVLLLGLDWPVALLIGAIVSSTDAAAVFGLLGQARLNQRVSGTLELESGANDPMAIFLVVVLVGVVAGEGATTLSGLAGTLALQLGLGALGGLVGGWVLVALLARLRLVEGLYALLVASGGLTLFALINLLGGSGFLAIYLAGVLVGNRRSDATDHVFRVMDGMAWLAQASMFLVLGLLATPSLMGERLPGAIAVATFLILVARPVAIWLGLAPFRYPLREIAFISWVGLRGAVPIVLALFPLLAGVEGGRVIFDLVFAVVLISLLVQGTTLQPMARLLRVEGPHRDRALDRVALQMPMDEEMELAQFAVPEASPWIGRVLADWREFEVPDSLVCTAVLREARLLPRDPELRIAAGDVLIVLQPRSAGDLLAEYLAPASGLTAVALGTFALDGRVEAGALAEAYGLRLTDAERSLSVADLVRARLRHPVVAGDQLDLGPVVLVVRQAERGRPVRLGLRLVADASD